MRELSLDHLRTLVATADLGSLAAAAKALHLAPPTVTVPSPSWKSAWAGRCWCAAAGRWRPPPWAARSCPARGGC
jgi:hypothetical protein